MPFDFNSYTDWCEVQTDNDLQEEYQKYVKLTAQGSTGIAVSVGLGLITFGLATIFGVAAAEATVLNASVKIRIIRDEMERRKKKHQLHVRPQDVFGGIGMAAAMGPVSHFVGPALLHGTSSGYVPSSHYTPMSSYDRFAGR
jgi:hypothetical protein